MGVRVHYSDGSERWCESCADPNDNGGSVVQGGTEHNAGGGSLASPGVQAPNSGSQGPGGNGPAGTQAAAATASDRNGGYASFYPSTYGVPSTGASSGGREGSATPSGGQQSGNTFGPNQPASSSAPNTLTGNNPLGTPKTNDEWSFDPTNPSRAISAGMSLLGLPSYGPAADFYARYGQAGISQSLADGSFVSPDSFKTEMTNRLQGINPSMDAASMIQSLMGGENLANQETHGGNVTSDPTSLARAAYIANSESDPNGIAQLLTGALTGNGVNMGSSVASMLGAFLGNVGTRRFNAATPQNDTMSYLGKLLGY